MDERRAEWSVWRRVLFRFVFLYFVIHALPFPLGQIPGTGSVAGWWGDLLHAVSRWVGTHVLGVEVVIQPTGSGDTAQAFTLLLVELVVAATGTLAWSLLARGRASHGRLLDALRTYVRFYLGATMLSYGAFKIIPTQFPYPSLVRLLEPLGNGSPMGLLWKFMGYSPAFSFFAGAGEFLGGFLIFFRRTTTLGALLLVVVLSNVVMMNYAYDVPVKLFSSHLLVMAGFLLLPDVRRLYAVLVLNRPTEARTLGALLPPGRARVAGWAVDTLSIRLRRFDERSFLLTRRGFHWISELPFNR